MLSKKYIATLWFALAMLALVPLPANGQTILFEDFEAGWGSWFADNGVWGVGTPTVGPSACHSGSQCAGTVLDANYPSGTSSRLYYSVGIQLPSAEEVIFLRYWQWFSYGSGVVGKVQISEFDGGNWSAWTDIGSSMFNVSNVWSPTGVDLTAYAGKTVRFAFYHFSSFPHGVSTGWYIDDIEIVTTPPQFPNPEDFENGWSNWWYADNGVWEIGTPSVGPLACHSGSQCAGTVLDANYPSGTNSRLITAPIDLIAAQQGVPIFLRYWQWFSYGSGVVGKVQISEFDGGSWSAWDDRGNPVAGISGVWSPNGVEITADAGKTVRFAFYHFSSFPHGVSTGWYIDNIEITGIVMDDDVLFKDGFE